MRLTRLELEQFRAYHHLDLSIPPIGLRVFGRNATGKTSLLEAIYLLSTSRSPRASLDRDMINWASNEEYELAPYARVIGHVSGVEGSHELEVALVAEPERATTTRKRIKIDGVPRRAVDMVGVLKTVLFSPEDLNLVLGSPGMRRRYLDITISQVDRTYLQSLSRYARLLDQRNSLLKDLGTRRAGARTAEEELSYWDEQVVIYGAYILAARLRYVGGLSPAAADAFRALAGESPGLCLRYVCTIDLPQPQLDRVRVGSMSDAQGLLARALESGLRSRRAEELRRGVTVLGPHRDDLQFLSDGRDIASFGSRGQQRLAVVATKLAELKQMLDAAGYQPVLLLDDVLSELDASHQDRLLAAIGEAGCQVIITGTERHLLEHPSLVALPIAETLGGGLRLETPTTST